LLGKSLMNARAHTGQLRTPLLAAAASALVLHTAALGLTATRAAVQPLAGTLVRASLPAARQFLPAARQSVSVRVLRQSVSVTAERVAEVVEQVRRAPLLADDAFAQALALGYALIGEARYAEAESLFGALAEKRPGDPAPIYGGALAVFNLGRVADAEPLARRAAASALAEASRARASGADIRERNARAADTLVLLAVVLAVRGDEAGALRAARQATGLAPDNFDAQFTLGRALYGAGDDAGATRAFRAAIALRPADARARFFLATTLEHAGDADGALAAYRELATREPRGAEGHLGAGVLLVKRGGAETDEGMRELERALEINPDLYEARVTLGRVLVARGRAAEAVAHLNRAALLAPGNPEPHYQLSLAYRRLGRKDDADAESGIVRRIHESRRTGGNTPPPKD
jgi:tetratricopeptide (TPR) repeat protein